MKRRSWTAEETLAIVLEGPKEKRPIAEIYREHQIMMKNITLKQKDHQLVSYVMNVG